MWRALLFAIVLSVWGASAARAQTWQSLAWETCRGADGADGPVLGDCRPVEGRIDPQGREMWLRAMVPAPTDDQPRALYAAGAASSRAWLNGELLGANGRPGASAAEESPGLYQTAFPIPDSVWREDGNELVVRLSSFHGGVRLDQPIGALLVGSWPPPSPGLLLAIVFAAAGALLAAAFGFGVIHAIRRTGSSLTLAAMAGVAALQAGAESIRHLFPYPYPLHVWRLGAIWMLAAAFAILLVAYSLSRFWPGARRPVMGLTLVAVGAAALTPGFDLKTWLTLLAGVAMAAAAAAAGVWARRPGARPTLVYLALFLAVGLLLPDWLLDLSYFLLAAGLVLPLLMTEVIRLGREDQGREAALTRAATRPDRLTVASARGLELVPIVDIAAVVGADDYVELRLAGGRRLLHAARLDRMETELPDGFVRIHRSAIANLAHVQGLTRDAGRWRLILHSGEILPISRTRLPTVRDALEDPGFSMGAGGNPLSTRLEG